MLPKGYEVPKTVGNYMKFQKGLNKFRVLSDAIVGWEYWNTAGKPVRSPQSFSKVPDDVRHDPKNDNPFKHFWAFVVWNYQDERVQILEITQKTIQQAIKGYNGNPDWGSPKEYDITVTREGDDLGTEYTVMPSPIKPLKKEIAEAVKKVSVDLTALYRGEDPFAKNKSIAPQIEYPSNEPNPEDVPF